MLKLFVLISAIVTLANATSLRISPEELVEVWEAIDRDINARQQEAMQEIQSLRGPMKLFLEDAKTKVITDMEDIAAGYWNETEVLEEDAKKNELNITSCLGLASEDLLDLNQTLVFTHNQLINQLATVAEISVEIAENTAWGVLTSLAKLGYQVYRCTDDECATYVETFVVDFYDMTIGYLDNAMAQSKEAVLVQLPQELENVQLNRELYEESLTLLLNGIKKCIQALTVTTDSS